MTDPSLLPPEDLSIPESFKAAPPTIETVEPAEPEPQFLRGRLVMLDPEKVEPTALLTTCVHSVPLDRGYWCGDCQDESARRQAKADAALRERKRLERQERGLL